MQGPSLTGARSSLIFGLEVTPYPRTPLRALALLLLLPPAPRCPRTRGVPCEADEEGAIVAIIIVGVGLQQVAHRLAHLVVISGGGLEGLRWVNRACWREDRQGRREGGGKRRVVRREATGPRGWRKACLPSQEQGTRPYRTSSSSTHGGGRHAEEAVEHPVLLGKVEAGAHACQAEDQGHALQGEEPGSRDPQLLQTPNPRLLAGLAPEGPQAGAAAAGRPAAPPPDCHSRCRRTSARPRPRKIVMQGSPPGERPAAPWLPRREAFFGCYWINLGRGPLVLCHRRR